MFEKIGGRKFVGFLVACILLFAGMAIGKVEGAVFAGGLGAFLITYVTGNVKEAKTPTKEVKTK